jgi:adenosylcobinamide-phosphate synthase
MSISLSVLVCAIAAGLDYLIGDPWNWWHPVQGLGWCINQYTRLAFKWLKHPLALKIAGIGLGLGLIVGSGLMAWGVRAVAYRWNLGLGIGLESVWLASCFAGCSLRDAANSVLATLNIGDLVATRSQLARYVGRDTEHLTEPEILRAVLETVAENATDGVLAPLFYAILGSWLGLGSLPLAFAYKAASTLDSMVGYRELPYMQIGWFSAKTEDLLTWFPCRLVVLTISLLSGKPDRVWQLCRRDADQDASPNSGWSECAYAAALGVQLGGRNTYRGVEKLKPLLGDRLYPITPEKIQQALKLTRWCFLIWLFVALVISTGFLIYGG